MERVGILGAGFISHSHAEALRNCGIKVYAIVDRSETVAKEFAKRWGVEHYGTTEDILFEEAVTSVHICTPPDTHYEIVKRLLEAGKNVICEKPLCFSNEEASELESLAKSKHLKCAINLNVRYHNMSSKVKELVQNPSFGSIHLVHGRYLQQFHLLPTPYNWRYIPELSGKMRAVTEIGTHWFDIIQYVTGLKIVQVSALFGNFNPTRILKDGMMHSTEEFPEEEKSVVHVDSEDVALINLKLSNGAIGSVVLSEISQGYSNYLAYEITGTKMTAGWNSQNNNEVYYNEVSSQTNVIKDGFGNGFNDSLQRLIADFYSEDVSKNKYPTFEEGANIVRICNAVYKSAINDSKWIDVE